MFERKRYLFFVLVSCMSTTLYRKYRPSTFSEVVGQKHVVQTLENSLKLGRIGQAYLLTGPRGTGKTTLARLFAKAVNCSKRKGAEPCGKCPHCLVFSEGRSLDVIEIDAASHTGVDNIRELRETVALPPSLGSHKIYIIDEVHMLSIGAFNALLKTIEEPPAHVIFILATTALHKVPDTIVSRCQRFDLSRFSVKSIIEKLQKIAQAEKLTIEKGALQMIALAAEGGMRDAESLLTQIASLEASPITEEKTAEILGATKRENISLLLHIIQKHELYPALLFVRKLSQDGVDLSVFSVLLLHFLRDMLLVSADPKNGLSTIDALTEEQQAELSKLAKLFTPNEIVCMLEHFQEAQNAIKTAVIPELPLEIALVKILSGHLPETVVPEQKNTETPIQKQTTPSKSIEPKPSQTKTAPVSSVQNTPSPATPSFDLSAIEKSWQAILNAAKRLNASISLALSNSRPIETDGFTITIAVKYPFHKERLDEPANRLTLEKAFDTILGARTKLRIVLESASLSQEAKQSVQENPLIHQAMEMLGGRIVPEN